MFPLYSQFLVMFKIFSLIFLGVYHVSADQLKLKFQPAPDETTSGLIWYNQQTYTKWSEMLDNYLEVYRTPSLTEGRTENLVNCSYEKPIKEDTVCYIKPDINPCTSTNHFGYKHGKPCVFIELDRILDWKPKYYNSTKSLPKKMPPGLRDLITGALSTSPRKWEMVWLWCDGDTPADKELIGPISYYPRTGYPGYMFPYSGQDGYLNPIVAVNFGRPVVGVVINVVCTLWGPSIIHDSHKQLGLTKFSILVDL